jgi:uncharacterized protein (DUF58 family)
MPKQNPTVLLTPEMVNSLSGLSLIAKVVVEGFMFGLNRSISVGPGMEFSQYRGYEPGDDLRLLDWKMLARSGRYYIKQSEIESHVTVKFILDATASMEHTEGELSKLQFARTIIACLAYMAHKQGDAVGLFALNERELKHIYPKADQKQYHRMLLELLKVGAHGKWPKEAIPAKGLQGRGEKELIFFITDMYEEGQELTDFITGLRSPRNEVVLLHLMGNAEMHLDYKDQVTFEDLETGAKVKVDINKARSGYLAQLQQKIKDIKDHLLTKGISYHRFQMDQPLGELLTLFLKERKHLR